jgi:hypothetical protein
MTSKRRLALTSAGLSLALSCAGPQMTERLQQAPEGNGPRSWLSASLNIQEPSQFRAWEPLASEIAGMAPVPSGEVEIVPSAEVKKACGDDAGGCYLASGGRILIDEKWSPGELARARYQAGWGAGTCRGAESLDLKGYPRLAVWIHEQGHHFDAALGSSSQDKWIDQAEAVAFEYYFAEHVARNYDRHLGLNLLLLDLGRSGFPSWGLLSDEDAMGMQARDFSEKIRSLARGGVKPDETGLSHQSFFVLLAGFRDFGSAWRFIHGHTNAEVAARIRQDAGLVAEGRMRAERIFMKLAGLDSRPDFRAGRAMDSIIPGAPLRTDYEPGSSLTVVFSGYEAAFHILGSGNRYITLRSVPDGGELDLAASFTPSRSPDSRSLTLSDGSGKLLEAAAGRDFMRSIAYSNSVMAGPSYCFSSEKDDSNDTGRYERSAASLFARVADSVEASGRAGEASFARRILADVFPGAE